MPPTIKEIALLAGVSRGTVDRVIHRRPGVSPEVRKSVEQILKEFEYEPNTAAVALKGVSRKISLGVVVPDLRNEFFHEVYEGIHDASKQYNGYGINILEYKMRDTTDEELIKGIDTLLEKAVHGIAMQAIDSEPVRNRIRELVPEFPVVTFNSDFTDTDIERLCFVGQDSFAAGRVAGQMMSMQLRSRGKIAVIIGHSGLTHQRERASGFCKSLQSNFPDMEMLPHLQTSEDEFRAYKIVSELISNTDDLVGIYAAGGGQKGVAAALSDSGRSSEIIMVGHDLLPKTMEYLESGVVNCTIAQEPYYQGYMPIEILSELLLFNRRPNVTRAYTSIDILIRENMNFGSIHSLSTRSRRTAENRSKLEVDRVSVR